MADTYNYRRGETNPVHAAVATIQAVSVGDMVALSSGYVYRAQDEAASHLSTAQYGFASRFAGVSAQRKVSGTAKPGTGGGTANQMRICSEGVFEFDVAATTLEVGQLMGPAGTATSTLESQKVVIVASAPLAIGTVEERKTDATTTKCKVRIFGTKMLAPIDKA